MGATEHRKTGHRRAKAAALGAIILAGFLARFVAIDRWPLWSDEALTLLIAQWPFGYLFFVPVDPTPGLYYSLHKLLLGPAVGTAGARAISLACGTLTIPAAYWLAREARLPGLLTAALVALSFPLIDYSQEARAYSLLVLLVILSAAFFVRWSRTREPFALFGTLASCLLAFYTHLTSIFWIGPIVLALFWLGRRKMVAPLLLLAILAVPELFRVSRYAPAAFNWLAQATPAEAAGTLARALLPFRPAAAWLLLAALLAAWRGWTHRTALTAWIRANRAAAFAIAVLALEPLIAWLFGMAARPIFMTRTILIGVPGALLAVALLMKFETKIVRIGIVGLYAASLVATGTTRPKEAWNQVAARVGGDAILMCEPGQVAAMRHALPGDNRIFMRREDGLAEMTGTPWQQSYFEIMSDRRRLAGALRRGRSVSPALHPVWPVRSGETLAEGVAPVDLGQAVAWCDARDPGRRPRYIAD